jgi:predicted porin
MKLLHDGRRWLIAGLLGLGAGAAQAQLDYSIYGVADFSYGRFEPSGQVREHRFNSNSLSPTFIGFGASYGLESGWTPGVTLEAFYRFQDLEFGRTDDDPAFSRNAFASLAHRDYGAVRVGRLQTLLFNTTTRFNALGNSVFSPAVRQVFNAGNLTSVQGDFYWNQAVGYTSPNIDGFSGGVIAARGESNNEGDLYGGAIVLARGVFAAAVSAQHVNINNGIDDPTKEDAWQVAANYNFGWANLFGLFTQTRDKGLDVQSDIASAGAAVPLGPGTILFQIASSTAEGPAVDRKQTTTSLAYVYAYNSELDFYVIGSDDRIRGQTNGLSAAIGVRYRHQ